MKIKSEDVTLKKKLLLTLSFILLVHTAPMSVSAEDIDQKIDSQTKKIEEIIKNEQDAKEYLATLETEIETIENEYQSVLSENKNMKKK